MHGEPHDTGAYLSQWQTTTVERSQVAMWMVEAENRRDNPFDEEREEEDDTLTPPRAYIQGPVQVVFPSEQG